MTSLRAPRHSRTSLATGMAALLLTALGTTACGGDDSDGDNDEGGAGGSGGGGGLAGAGGTGTGDPWVDVPPEQLPSDPATACPGAYATTPPVEGLNLSYEAAGQQRGFVLLLPAPVLAPPHPMFVAFNGTGESGPSFTDRAELADFAARGFIVVAPSSAGNGTIYPVWDAMHAADDPDDHNADLALFDSLVACVAGHYPTDRHRIYAGGHSAGGIMTNYLLQHRSELLAGGIPASGVHSLTGPPTVQPLSPLLALVTWGGDNDAYSGGAGGVDVPEINFVEQAAIASKFYAEEPNVGQVNCHGDNWGHAWLSPVNDWMVDLLLAHPKGMPGAGGIDVPVNPGVGVTCSNEIYEYTGGLSVTCPTESSTAGCPEFCQFTADCVAENATIGPILAPELSGLGFSGPDNTDCTGCVSHCESTATTAADAEVLSCISTAQQSTVCGPGIDGGLPLIDAINTCCAGRSDSPFCMDTCAILLGNTATHSFLSACLALVG